MNVRGNWRRDRFAVGLALIALAGLVGRVIYVVCMRDRSVLGDGPFYHYSANLLVDGYAFVNPHALLTTGVEVPYAGHPPAWTLVLAGPSAVGLDSYLSHQLVACVVGTATIIMTGLAGRVAFGRRAGLIAAALLALYPNAWIYEREVQAETLALLGVATTIWLAYRFRARPSLGQAVALGATVGFVVMARPELLALTAFLLAPLILSAAGIEWQRRAAWLAAAGIACALVMLPWSIYNLTRFERPVPLTTSLGTTMLAGNCEPAYHGERLGFYSLGCAVLQRGLSSDRSIADGQERRIAIEFMRDNASRVPVVMAARVGRTFGVFRPFQQMHFDTNRNTDLWVIRSGFFMYWALVPLAIAGAVIARRRRIPIYPLLAFPAIVLLTVLMTIGQTRYRATAEISLVLLASVSVDAGMRAWSRRRGRPGATDAELDEAVHLGSEETSHVRRSVVT
jgi:4-amino-4-deoxy-L-arabinose transferase-like glycosyltransferase